MEKIQKNTKLDNLYVVVAIFNPSGYKKRYDLYYQFEAHMKDYKINLITIECIYEDNQEYSVTNSNNPMHIQVKVKDSLWHKENLINYAIRCLPSSWEYVLWLDADIEFNENDWPERIIKSFENYEIIQVFKHADFLGPDKENLETHFSFTYAIVNDIPIDRRFYNLFYPHPGYGWGITKSAFNFLNGLIDFGVLGSGDCHMAFALIGQVEQSLCFDYKDYHPNYLNLLRQWQNKSSVFLENKKIGYADCSIKHYFHGYREDRKYVERMKILINHKFDPINDIMYDNSNLIRWKGGKELLKSEVKNYFDCRKEDRTDYEKKELVSCNLTPKTVDEILKNGEKLRKKIEMEKFKNVIDKFASKPQNEKNEKRSKSSKAPINKSRDRKRRSNQGNNKKIEMYIQFGLGDNESNDSKLSNSTENNDDHIDSQEFSSIGSLSPNRSFNNKIDFDNLINKYGCCSSKKKEILTKNDQNLQPIYSNNGQSNNNAQINNNYNTGNRNNNNIIYNNARSNNVNNNNNSVPFNYNNNQYLLEEERRKIEIMEEERRKRERMEEERRNIEMMEDVRRNIERVDEEAKRNNERNDYYNDRNDLYHYNNNSHHSVRDHEQNHHHHHHHYQHDNYQQDYNQQNNYQQDNYQQNYNDNNYYANNYY